MIDVYSSRPLKRNKCKMGFVEVNGVCVPIGQVMSSTRFPNPPPTPPTPPTPPRPIQPRNSDLGLKIGEGVAITGGIGGLGYGAYRNRGAIQRNMRRMTQPKVKVDEEMGLLDEDENEAFFRQQQQRTGMRVRSQEGIRNRNIESSRATREVGSAEERTPFLRRTPRSTDTDTSIEMKTRKVKNVEETEGSFVEAPKRAAAEEEVTFGGVEIESTENDSLLRNIERETEQREAERQAQIEAEEERQIERAKFESKQMKGGLDAGAEEPVDLVPITEEELSGMKSNTALIDDLMNSKTIETPKDIPTIDPFIDSIGANEEAVFSADIVAAGSTATTLTEVASAIVPELAVGLVVGGALYGLEQGVEVVFDVGKEQDKKYHDKRNKEEGSHEMDKREIDYKLKELNSAKKYYKDQVEHHNFGSDEASQIQHEKDKAMLSSIQKSIDAIHNQQQNGEPVYSVVSNGFDANSLSSEEKKEYDRLVKRVDDQQDEVNYHGGDKERLANRQRKLDRFIDEHSDTPVSIGIVNKATNEQLEQMSNEYIKNGGDIFEGLDPEMMKVIGVADAIGTDEVQIQRMEVEEAAKNEETTDDIASSQGLATTVNDGVGSIM